MKPIRRADKHKEEKEMTRAKEQLYRDVLKQNSTRDIYRMIYGIITEGLDVNEELIIAMKREIRFRNRMDDLADTSRIVRNDLDGYTVLIVMADEDAFADEAEADAYFEDRFFIRISPSPYDCTGKLFTSWYKCFRRHGKWMAYHSVSADV